MNTYRQTIRLAAVVWLVVLVGLIFTVTSVNAQALTWSGAGTLNINGSYYTVLTASVATEITIGATTLIVTTGAGETFTLQSSDGYGLSNNGGITTTCTNGTRQVIVPASTTVTITPDTSSQCQQGGSSTYQLLRAQELARQSSGGGGGGSTPVSTPTTTPTTPTTPVTTTPTPQETVKVTPPDPNKEYGRGIKEEPVKLHSLVTSPSTKAVYYIDQDGKRHVFVNALVYKSWYGDDFSKVIKVSDKTLSSFTLGTPVSMRPGKMIKIESDPKVYLVTANRMLRHISTEEVAKALFGNTWNKQITDVSVSLFITYQTGDQITNANQINLKSLESTDISINSEIKATSK